MRIESFVAPLVFAIGAATITTCMIVSHAENQYFDGYRIPFVSQTGREGVAYWIFAVGLTIVGICSNLVGYLEACWIHKVRDMLEEKRFRCQVSVMLACFCSSGLFFAVMAWSNAIYFYRRNAIGLHLWTTVAAYALAVLAVNLNAYVTAQLLKRAGPNTPHQLQRVLRRSKRVKTAACLQWTWTLRR